jgi:hypothetical protein
VTADPNAMLHNAPLRDFGEANVRFGSKADIGSPAIDVRFTPKSELMHRSRKRLFDHRVGGHLNGYGHVVAKRLD